MAGRGESSLGPAIEAAVEDVCQTGRKQAREARIAIVARLIACQLQGFILDRETR
jgi:hypothetical protein